MEGLFSFVRIYSYRLVNRFSGFGEYKLLLERGFSALTVAECDAHAIAQ